MTTLSPMGMTTLCPGVDRVSGEVCFVTFYVIFDLMAENTYLT
jgi:hypothetical protein